MPRGSDYFRFKQFVVYQQRDVMRVNTDGVLLGAWTPAPEGHRILEVGTGTGVVALQLLQRGAHSVDAIDIDLQACEQARANADLSPWAHQIQVIQTSFQEYAEQCDVAYDLVVSNPPYYVGALPSPNARRNVMRHADTLPLEDLVAGLTLCLARTGRFVAIFPIAEGSQFIALAAQAGLYCCQQVQIADQPMKRTKRLLCEFAYEKCTPKLSEIFIHDSSGEFSQEYKALTQSFYLDF
jgi:ribosomal protein L11 methyltransferase (prmA)